MINLDPFATAGVRHGWALLLAFTGAVLAVGVFRKHCRRAFGAERAFLLWLLPPIAMGASQLPHSERLRVIVLPTVVNTLAGVADATSMNAADGIGMDWHAWLVLVWVAGAVFMLIRATIAQSRYRARLHGAVRVNDPSSHWPVVRARYVDVGPSLVGAWRPRIVLPSDFDERYDITERTLILTHESMHARRCDGWWSLCGQIVVAVFWFHPMAWLGWNAFRHDQELACDAAVINRHGNLRRSYANAMLKTQSATLQLPIGCSWSPRHPITERIAMLTLRTPGRRRKFAGTLFISLGTVAAAGFAYAATQNSTAIAPVVVKPTTYQLAVSISRGGKHVNNFTLCSDNTQPMMVTSVDSQSSLQLTLAVKSVGKDQAQVDVNGTLDEAGHRTNVTPTLRGPLGQPMSVVVGGPDGKSGPLDISMTPTVGCSASSVVVDQATITQSIKDGHVRQVAQAVASKAGYVLINPDALDEQPITFNFEQIPAEKALQLIAKIDGKAAVFHGKQVQFEAASGG